MMDQKHFAALHPNNKENENIDPSTNLKRDSNSM